MGKYAWISIGCVAFVVIAWVASYYIIGCSCSISDAGSIGDRFGAINALFTGLAFAGLIVTLLMQRDDLKLQRKDLALQREVLKLQQQEMEKTNIELAGQKEQFQLQNKTLAKQQFENTFFQMLGQVNSICNNINKGNRLGQDAFTELYKTLHDTIKYTGSTDRFGNPLERSKDEMNKNNCITLYKSFYSNYSFCGVYFRSAYRLIRYVEESELENYEKYQYTSFFRSQITDDILLMTFYACALDVERSLHKDLLEKYAILKNMPKEKLVCAEHLEWFDNKAFSGSDRFKKGMQNS